MKERICPSCGQPIPQPEGRLICSQCGAPILKGQRWTHGGDSRPKHRDCSVARVVTNQDTGIIQFNPPQEHSK